MPCDYFSEFLRRLFADLLTPDKAKRVDNQPFCFEWVGMRRLERPTPTSRT